MLQTDAVMEMAMVVLTVEAVVMMEACDELDADDVGRSDGGTVVVADGANNDDSDFGSSGGCDGAGDNNDYGCTGSAGRVMVLCWWWLCQR